MNHKWGADHTSLCQSFNLKKKKKDHITVLYFTAMKATNEMGNGQKKNWCKSKRFLEESVNFKWFARISSTSNVTHQMFLSFSFFDYYFQV